MGNLFKIGSKMLKDAFTLAGSETIAYYSANGTLIPSLTTATVIGISIGTLSMPMEAYSVEDIRVDFVVDPADLGINTPEDGWYIMYNKDGLPADGIRYTVFELVGKHTTSDSDEFGNRIRIHTRKFRG